MTVSLGFSLKELSLNENTVTVAKHVLQLESQAIDALHHCLDGVFLKVVSEILQVKGRVIVTGMGKSGHIARKIAATLASTGTPAFFVHPAEASHGDMGMITPSDIIIALSNSGETNELVNLLHFSRRYQVPVVAFTANPHSALAQAADFCLLLPNVPEGCSLGLAPTTSTTAMLALGDALAMSILENRNFSPQDYKSLHPGGNLGRRLLQAKDVMHCGEKIPLVPPSATMDHVLLTMSEKSFGCAGVVNDDVLIGVVTDGDLRRHMGMDLLGKRAEEIMTSPPYVIHPATFLAEALEFMNKRGITSLFVVEDLGKVLGIMHIHDCLRVGIQ